MEIIPMKIQKKVGSRAAKHYEDVEVTISNGDFIRMQELAKKKGLTFNTFITSVLHKVSTGKKVQFAHEKQK